MAGILGTGTGTSPGTDVVVWARALGVGTTDEVQGELTRIQSRVAEVLGLLQALLDEVAEYPDEALAGDVRTALGHIEQVGGDLAHVTNLTGSTP